MKSKRIRIDCRFSALAVFRAWRRHLGARQAYWLVVCRYGWPEQSKLAWDFLAPIAKRISTQTAA